MFSAPDSVKRPITTFMSRSWTWSLGIRSHHLRLVRSLQYCTSVVLAMLAPSCLFPDPPVWEGPQKTRPQLTDPTPPTSQLWVKNLNDTLEVTVNEWSEDAGIAVRAIWYLDYLPPKMTYLNNRDYAPGHLDDAKVLDITWQVIIAAPACSTFTLLVTHVDNDSNDLNHTPINPDDVATITWWLSSNDTDSTSPVALSSCPKSGEATP